MTLICHNCHAEITDRYHARSYHVRNETRWLCGSLQACAMRAVEQRLGWTVAAQQAYFAGRARVTA